MNLFPDTWLPPCLVLAVLLTVSQMTILDGPVFRLMFSSDEVAYRAVSPLREQGTTGALPRVS